MLFIYQSDFGAHGAFSSIHVFKSIYCPLTSFPYKSNIIVSYTNKCKLYRNTYKVSDVILYTNEINWKRTLLNAERVSQRPRSTTTTTTKVT